jgi:hypothetical protein
MRQAFAIARLVRPSVFHAGRPPDHGAHAALRFTIPHVRPGAFPSDTA